MPGLNHGIEKIARLEFVVAQKLVRRAVEGVRARAAGGVDHGAATAELGRVRIRQRLKLGNRLDAERRSQAPRARSVVPEIHHVLVVQQVSLAGRTRSRDRILLSISVERAACAWSPQRNLCHARSQRQKLCEVSAI